MSFAFINNSDVSDQRVRRRIRSHVAMGRNLGRTLVRPSRAKASKPQAESTIAAQVHPPPSFIHRQIGDVLSVIPFSSQIPVSCERVAKRAISFMTLPRHSPQIEKALDTSCIPSMWARLMFSDVAYFHTVIAVSITALNRVCIEKESEVDGMRHISQAISLLNRRIQAEQDVSNETMAVVVMMSQYERDQRRYAQSLIHLEGLLRMIRLRGGIKHLIGTDPQLTRKILRADLESSLYLGTRTKLNVRDAFLQAGQGFWQTMATCDRPENNHVDHFKSEPMDLLHSELRLLFLDAARMANYVNNALSGLAPKVSIVILHDFILLLGYRVVDIQPLREPRLMSALETLVHIGLSGFVLTLFTGHNHAILNIPFLASLGRSTCETSFDLSLEHPRLFLWTLLISATSFLTPDDDTWLVPAVRNSMRTQKLHTWEDVSQVLNGFPWIGAFHDRIGKLVWQKAASFTSLGIC